MYKYKNINRINGRKLPWLIVSCGWVVSTITALVLVYGIGDYFVVDMDCRTPGTQCFSTAGAILYATFARAAWGVVIGWIIFACHTGYGGKFPNANTKTNSNILCFNVNKINRVFLFLTIN